MLLLRIKISLLHDNNIRGDVHGDVDELDEVTDEAHDRKTNSDRLGDLNELCMARIVSEMILWSCYIRANLCGMAWYTG